MADRALGYPTLGPLVWTRDRFGAYYLVLDGLALKIHIPPGSRRWGWRAAPNADALGRGVVLGLGSECVDLHVAHMEALAFAAGRGCSIPAPHLPWLSRQVDALAAVTGRGTVGNVVAQAVPEAEIKDSEKSG